jgi:membrane-associated phospholipid phosphatase
MRFGLSGRGKTLVLATTVALGLATPSSADSDFIETSGRVLMIGLPVAGGAYALYKGDRQGLLQIGASVASAYGVSFLLQKVVKEERPDHSDWDSFPSDSTAIAFSAASSIQVRYGWDYGLPAYAIAAYVGYSRVEADKHHWGDVAAGAAIGALAGWLLTDPYEEMPQMQVFADTGGAGINLRWNF